MTRRLVFIGDYSGLSLFLNKGVEEVGGDTVIFSNGDGWKDVPRNAQLYKPGTNKLSWAWNQVIGGLSVGREVTKADTLVLATELLFHPWVNTALLANLMRKAGRTVLLHAGCTAAFHKLQRDQLLCKNCKQFDMPGGRCVADYGRWPMLRPTLQHLDLVIPFTSIYTESARGYGVPESQVSEPLHFPVDFNYVQGMVQREDIGQGAIHGQNRLGFKGTIHLNAMLAARPSLAPYIELLPRMNFARFVSHLGNANIVLDQLYANGYGMSGALALATGTTVAYGHTLATALPGFDGPGCLPIPIVGEIEADAESLERALVQHLAHLPSRETVRQAARARHDHVHIARQFLQRLAGL